MNHIHIKKNSMMSFIPAKWVLPYYTYISALLCSTVERWKLNRAAYEFCVHHTAIPPVRLQASRLTSLNFSASVSPTHKCANNPHPVKFDEGEMI